MDFLPSHLSSILDLRDQKSGTLSCTTKLSSGYYHPQGVLLYASSYKMIWILISTPSRYHYQWLFYSLSSAWSDYGNYRFIWGPAIPQARLRRLCGLDPIYHGHVWLWHSVSLFSAYCNSLPKSQALLKTGKYKKTRNPELFLTSIWIPGRYWYVSGESMLLWVMDYDSALELAIGRRTEHHYFCVNMISTIQSRDHFSQSSVSLIPEFDSRSFVFVFWGA